MKSSSSRPKRKAPEIEFIVSTLTAKVTLLENKYIDFVMNSVEIFRAHMQDFAILDFLNPSAREAFSLRMEHDLDYLLKAKDSVSGAPENSNQDFFITVKEAILKAKSEVVGLVEKNQPGLRQSSLKANISESFDSMVSGVFKAANDFIALPNDLTLEGSLHDDLALKTREYEGIIQKLERGNEKLKNKANPLERPEHVAAHPAEKALQDTNSRLRSYRTSRKNSAESRRKQRSPLTRDFTPLQGTPPQDLGRNPITYKVLSLSRELDSLKTKLVDTQMERDYLKAWKINASHYPQPPTDKIVMELEVDKTQMQRSVRIAQYKLKCLVLAVNRFIGVVMRPRGKDASLLEDERTRLELRIKQIAEDDPGIMKLKRIRGNEEDEAKLRELIYGLKLKDVTIQKLERKIAKTLNDKNAAELENNRNVQSLRETEYLMREETWKNGQLNTKFGELQEKFRNLEEHRDKLERDCHRVKGILKEWASTMINKQEIIYRAFGHSTRKTDSILALCSRLASRKKTERVLSLSVGEKVLLNPVLDYKEELEQAMNRSIEREKQLNGRVRAMLDGWVNQMKSNEEKLNHQVENGILRFYSTFALFSRFISQKNKKQLLSVALEGQSHVAPIPEYKEKLEREVACTIDKVTAENEEFKRRIVQEKLAIQSTFANACRDLLDNEAKASQSIEKQLLFLSSKLAFLSSLNLQIKREPINNFTTTTLGTLTVSPTYTPQSDLYTNEKEALKSALPQMFNSFLSTELVALQSISDSLISQSSKLSHLKPVPLKEIQIPNSPPPITVLSLSVLPHLFIPSTEHLKSSENEVEYCNELKTLISYLNQQLNSKDQQITELTNYKASIEEKNSENETSGNTHTEIERLSNELTHLRNEKAVFGESLGEKTEKICKLTEDLSDKEFQLTANLQVFDEIEKLLGSFYSGNIVESIKNLIRLVSTSFNVDRGHTDRENASVTSEESRFSEFSVSGLPIDFTHLKSELEEEQNMSKKHEYQIVCLKKYIRDIERQLKTVSSMHSSQEYYLHVKELLKQLIIGLPRLNDELERMLSILMTILALSTEEKKTIEMNRRKSVKSKILGIFNMR